MRSSKTENIEFGEECIKVTYRYGDRVFKRLEVVKLVNHSRKSRLLGCRHGLYGVGARLETNQNPSE